MTAVVQDEPTARLAAAQFDVPTPKSVRLDKPGADTAIALPTLVLSPSLVSVKVLVSWGDKPRAASPKA